MLLYGFTWFDDVIIVFVTSQHQNILFKKFNKTSTSKKILLLSLTKLFLDLSPPQIFASLLTDKSSDYAIISALHFCSMKNVPYINRLYSNSVALFIAYELF